MRFVSFRFISFRKGVEHNKRVALGWRQNTLTIDSFCFSSRANVSRCVFIPSSALISACVNTRIYGVSQFRFLATILKALHLSNNSSFSILSTRPCLSQPDRRRCVAPVYQHSCEFVTFVRRENSQWYAVCIKLRLKLGVGWGGRFSVVVLCASWIHNYSGRQRKGTGF